MKKSALFWIFAFFLSIFPHFLSGKRAAEAICSIALHPFNGTFTGWGQDQFEAVIDVTPLKSQSGHTKIQSWEFAIRSLTHPEKTMRLQHESFMVHKEIGAGLGGSGYFKQFTEKQIQNLNGLGEGTFECAILVNGVRCSNVVLVRIDSEYKPTKEPVLRVVPIQPVGVDHVTHIGIWIVPAQKPGSRLTCFSPNAKLILVVDGIEYRHLIVSGNGLDGGLPAGKPWGTIMKLSGFHQFIPDLARKSHTLKELLNSHPQIPVKVKYEVQAKLFEYESSVVGMIFDPNPGAEFDRVMQNSDASKPPR